MLDTAIQVGHLFSQLCTGTRSKFRFPERSPIPSGMERNAIRYKNFGTERNGALNLGEIFSSVPERIFPLLHVILEL